MTSGEWDLRALKALEAEEQKEFLRRSQTNLLEPPPPPTVAALPAHHPQLLLPTISECRRNAPGSASGSAAASVAASAPGASGSGAHRLKFTRALSLSAHSLVFAKHPSKSRRPAHPSAAKSIGSLSPTPLCTPPPIRRCATLHPHSAAPLRKHCRQLLKQELRRAPDSQLLPPAKSPQLQRIGGTNKTFWKYGANSTAASIVGERRLRRAAPEDHDATSAESPPVDRDSSGPADCDDSATETGSCTVPLAADSIKMMRLMLSTASSAVSGSASSVAPSLGLLGATTPDLTASTSGVDCGPSAPATRFFSLARHSVKPPDSREAELTLVGETVAYEAFQAHGRRRSFSGADGRAKATVRRPTASPNNSNQNNKQNSNSITINSSHGAESNRGATAPVAACAAYNRTLLALGGRASVEVPVPEGAGAQATKQLHHLGKHAKGTALCLGGGAGAGSGLQMCVALGEGEPHPFDDELEQHIKHCSCSCNHMGYGNSMDYQTTGFGGLPDVTEHSNIRRTLSRQNSISNSDSGAEIASIQKSKPSAYDDVKAAAAATATATATMPSTLTAMSSGTIQRKKHKTAQSGGTSGVGIEHYKSRRATCIFGLTLLVALGLLAVAATLAGQHFFMTPSRNSHAQRLRIVRRVLQEVPLVDGHNNFAWNVRKYAHSSLELVHLSHDLDHKAMWTRPAWAQTDMERLKQGLLGVQVWSAYVPCEAQGLDAVQLALEQIDIIRRFTDMYSEDTLLVASSKDIAAARRQGLMASLIGIEGGHAIGSSLGVLRSFYSLGARYLSLTHKCDVSWAGSSSSLAPSENGLSQFGKAIIREMNRLGMMIDLSYSSDATARDVLQATRAPVIFSHSAARQLCNSTRNIPDDVLRLVAENGGLIMVSFDSEDVACGRPARLTDVVDHIKYIRSIAGIQHIGLGAGYDGIELPPIGLEDVSKYPDLLATLLEDHNWSEEDVAMLAGLNFMRIMETVENVRDYWKRAAIQPIEQTEPQPKTQCTYMSS